MAEYSIAKSFKGILRIAHIIDTVEGDPDTFLNPTYYGTPTAKVNINTNSSVYSQKGTPTAEHSLLGNGTITRYQSNDKLTNRRVPMTDSMGNYINWNVGLDGVTIGSNSMINDSSVKYDKFFQKGYDNFPIYQEKFFPIYETTRLSIGRINKEHRSDNKSNINASHLEIQSSDYPAKLIIQNLYDKSQLNSEELNVFRQKSDNYYTPVKVKNYKQIVGNNNKYDKVRTVYNMNKTGVENFDVVMYRQNDFNVNDWETDTEGYVIKTTDQEGNEYYSNQYNANFPSYSKEKVLECNVDMVNFKDYIKKSIRKFTGNNVTEVPSGTVIWQYCSLDKWRAIDIDGTGNDITSTSFPGHRPLLEYRTRTSEESGIPTETLFYSNTIQGASRKENRLRNKGNILQEKDMENGSMTLHDDNTYLGELIPLYKRDYVLCDGSKYKIMFFPQKASENLNDNRAAYERFFELFFNIGYKYTPKEKMYNRPKIRTFEGDSRFYVANSNGAAIIDKKTYNQKLSQWIETGKTEQQFKKSWGDFNDKSHFGNNVDNDTNLFEYNDTQWQGWTGAGAPNFANTVSDNSVYGNCEDIEILFGEDLGTMIACDMIFNFVKSYFHDNATIPSREQIINFCKDESKNKFDERLIFNSFVGWNKGIKVPYKTIFQPTYNNPDRNPKEKIIYINIGKEVNSLDSEILFYDTYNKKTVSTYVYNLPMVQYFIDLMVSGMNIDTWVLQYCYSFYNYDFCVPSLMADDDTPTFIGSCGALESDEYRWQVKQVIQWNSKYNHASSPHRHGVFAGKTMLDDLNTYKPANTPSHYRFGELNVNSLEPVNIATYYGGDIHPYDTYNKKGWASAKSPRFIEDGKPNYIINQFHTQLREMEINGMSTLIMENDGMNKHIQIDETQMKQIDDDTKKLLDVAGFPYGWATGGHRILLAPDETAEPTPDENNVEGNAQGRHYEDTPPYFTSVESLGYVAPGTNPRPDDYELPVNDDASDKLSQADAYLQSHKRSWYALLPFEDPRTDTAEPNRGITSEPIPTGGTIEIEYKKMSINANKYGTKRNNAEYGFFSPEHINMLPLIKL